MKEGESNFIRAEWNDLQKINGEEWHQGQKMYIVCSQM